LCPKGAVVQMQKKERLGRGLEDFSHLFRSSSETKKEEVSSPEPDMTDELSEFITSRVRPVQKMRLVATYSKDAKGFINSTIKVLDRGDFPTPNIFKSSSDDPAAATWDLEEGAENTISHTSPNSDEARQWVLAQVKVFKARLQYWRNIPVPEPEEFHI
jgi:hypothetical protein